MNKHILLVKKWLKDKDSVTQEELEANAESAASEYHTTSAVFDAAYNAAYDAWAAWEATRSVDSYFEITGEDKQTYLNNL